MESIRDPLFFFFVASTEVEHDQQKLVAHGGRLGDTFPTRWAFFPKSPVTYFAKQANRPETFLGLLIFSMEK